MVSPHVRIGEGTGVEEGHILLKEKFQLHLKEIFNLHKDHNGNAHILKSPPKRTEVERKEEGEQAEAGGIFVCKLDRLCEYERIRKGRT